MKKIILLITTVFLLYMSSNALEPVRIGLNYPTGASFVVELNDYTDPNNPIKKYPLPTKPDFVKTLTPNTSGVVSFVVGEGDPDWGGIAPTNINPNVIVDVKVSGNLVAQFNLLDMITTQASTGNGNILNDGFSSAEGVTFPDTTSLTNDFVFGSVKLDRLSSVEETKFFFDHSKAAFRTGRVNTDSWNEANLGEFTFAAGKDNKASGNGAVAFGEGTTAPSYGEVAIGSYNTTYVPNSATAVDNNDRAFVIGNGTSATPSDAFIIQKNGNMTVGGSLTVLGATVTNSNLTVGGTTIDPNTGNLVVAGTSTLNDNVSITTNKTLTVGTGLTSLGGGLTVSAGAVTLPADAIADAEVVNTLTVDGGTINNTPIGATGAAAGTFTSVNATTGGVTAAAGNITATLGNLEATAGSVSAGTTVTAGTGITATTGGVTAAAGNITATLGNLEATAGSVSAGTTVTAGTGVTATTGGVTAAAGNITATLGNLEATAGSVSAGTTVTAGTGITATTGGVTAAAGNITATLGNLEATAGSVTAGNGLTVTTGATSLTSLGGSGNRSLFVDNTGVVTASNGANARQASGMFTGTATLTGGNVTEAISVPGAGITGTSVIIITYFGAINEGVRITVQGAGSFTVSTEGTNFTAGDKIHYMIINN